MTNFEVQHIVNAIRSVDEPEKIILFGSRAKDEATEESDIDLLIIEDKEFNNGISRRQLRNKIRKALADIKGAKDILVYSNAEVEQWKSSVNHVIASCLQEGKVLYERH